MEPTEDVEDMHETYPSEQTATPGIDDDTEHWWTNGPSTP